MDYFLIIAGGLITVIAIVPYLFEVVKGSTKPRIVTWSTWTLINSIACAAAFSDGQKAAGTLMLCATIEVFLVVVFGIRRGNFNYEFLDVICQIGAVVGLVAWYFSKSPAIATLIMLATDVVAATPTLTHAWRKPSEETLITFEMSAFGAILILPTIGVWTVTSATFPVYTVILNTILCCLILFSRRRFRRSRVV